MFRLKKDSESGMVLLVAVVVTFLGTILAGSFMSITIYEARHSVWQKHRAQSLFLAEAGVEQALYFLNNTDDPDNPWVDEYGEMRDTPLLDYRGDLSNGYYEIDLYSPSDFPWLPAGSYLIKSAGFLELANGEYKESRVSCIVCQLPALPIVAALSILDSADPEIELFQFDSAEWSINGEDMDKPGTGLPGIAIANEALDSPDNIIGDDLLAQLGDRLEQVEGICIHGNVRTGEHVILADPDLPQDLDAYADYFESIAINISGVSNIPKELLGTYEEPTVLYANLTEGPIRLLPNQPGYGVLILDGKGDFRFDVSVEGKAEWFGVIICARDSEINLYGGGSTASHIYGALLIADGTVTMNGSADIIYSSDNVNNVNVNLLLYQVYSWCGGWGEELGEDYDPVATGEPTMY